MIRPLAAVLCAMLGIGAAPASTVVPIAACSAPASHAVRLWTSDALRATALRWSDGFRRQHPQAAVAVSAPGSDVAMAALYTCDADVALIGREPTASELQAFEWIHRYQPTRIEVLTGSASAGEASPALAVFVQRENPLAGLTLHQLGAVFGYEHNRVRSWDQLGVGGGWSAKPIALYGPDMTSGSGTFFRHAVLGDSRKLDWDRMHELGGDAEILAALAHDRFGIAVAHAGAANPDVKTIALAGAAGEAFVAPTPENVASRRYPLARPIYALYRRAPDRPVDPLVDAFVQYVLSAEGQAAAAAGGTYFPLPVQAPARIYAQALVDETAARNPDLRAVAIIATRPKATTGGVVASHGDASLLDAHTIELPLLDTSGDPAGTLHLNLGSHSQADAGALQRRAETIRDALARRVLNAANLFDPDPLDPSIPTNTAAQRLVDGLMSEHRELLSLALHVTLPERGKNVILASSFGRIGKKADDDDMKVITSGVTSTGVYAGGKRFGAELALRDARGATIGALSVGYAYAPGSDAGLTQRAEQLRAEMQHQFDSVETLLATQYVPAQYDLSALPPYQPRELALGVLRIYGTPLEALVGRWANEFRARQGHVRLNAYLINTSQAFAGLVTGQADIGLMGHRTWHTTLMAFRETYGYAPLEIRFASGSYDDPEWTTPGPVFIVNKNNPLAQLSVEQIDGIFGTQRTGGWNGTTWSTHAARGPEKNIRTWGQLGLTGAWANKPIHPRGTDVTLSNWADLVERVAFGGNAKWNPALYEGPRADISWKAHGKTRDQQIVEGVENDPGAIAFTFQRVVDKLHADVKVLPIAAHSGGPFVVPSAQTFFDGSYPFHNGAYLYVNRVPGRPIAPLVKEFLRFVLSREGQQIIADSRLFVPLNAAQAQAELEKLK